MSFYGYAYFQENYGRENSGIQKKSNLIGKFKSEWCLNHLLRPNGFLETGYLRFNRLFPVYRCRKLKPDPPQVGLRNLAGYLQKQISTSDAPFARNRYHKNSTRWLR